MATLGVGGDLFVDMSVMDFSVFFFGEISVASKKRYVLEFPDTDEIVDFRGAGFKYNKAFTPTGGDLEGFTFYQTGARTFQIAGVDVSVKAFVKAAETASTADDFKVTAQMFSGKDTISGGAQADGLMGFKGKDIIHGAGGGDVMLGGAGADKFVYLNVSDSTTDAPDSIMDFKQSQKDKIVLSELGELDFIGKAEAFSGAASEVGYDFNGGNTYVVADVDGDGLADMHIMLKGEIDLTASDFIL